MNCLHLIHSLCFFECLSLRLPACLSACLSYLGCDELLAADLVGLLEHHAGPLHQVALLHRGLVHPGVLQVNLVLYLFINGFLLGTLGAIWWMRSV